MNVGKIVLDSLKYPFRNIKKLPIIFIFFILIATIPIALISDNRYLLIFGVIALFAFVLFVPGYLFSMVKIGLNESSAFPSMNFGDTIYDSIRVLVLRAAYMAVPVCLFCIVLSILSVSGADLLFNLKLTSLLALGMAFILVFIIYLLFEVLLFFAKARLAYLNSLSEALKIHKVIGDIRNIGVFNIIKWLIFMAVLMCVFSFISSWVMSIPYIGFLIYIGIVIPILESVANYSLGLLYSNIAENNNALAYRN